MSGPTVIPRVFTRGWEEGLSQNSQCDNGSRGQRKRDLKSQEMQMSLESGGGKDLASQEMQPC